MSNSHPPSAPSAADLAGISVEPDNVPTRFLAIVGGALTIVVVGMVMIGIALFESERAAQFEAKGYGDIDHIPAHNAP